MDDILHKLEAIRFQRLYDQSRAETVYRLREIIQMLPYATDDECLSALVNQAATLARTLGTIEHIGEIGRSLLAAQGIR